jgi:Uncharacterized protein conserved in bacteria (DUF2252)
MNILKATKSYESWVGRHTRLIQRDLETKHEHMAESLFHFLRATFYRWVQVWPEVCPGPARAPRVLAVGDLHVENFGTWRDSDGRLVWGINDFDEANLFPYTIDLVRLATSAYMAGQQEHLTIQPKAAMAAILEGYVAGLKEGGRPFVLGEDHVWLRQIAESELRDPVVFWQKMDRLPAVTGKVPKSARKALQKMLPQRGLKHRVAFRVAGLGSLGHMRFVALAEWNGGRVAREAKAVTPSAIHWVDQKNAVGEIMYCRILEQAVRCPDPWVRLCGRWIVRRLSPHCSRIELESMVEGRDELRLLYAMGFETANVHLGTERKRKAVLKDLQSRKGNWLSEAAQAMDKAMAEDWEVWRRHWKGQGAKGKKAKKKS